MRPQSDRLRVVLLGYVVGFPLGGMTWHSVQYLTGLRSLGHDVWFVEDSGDWDSCYDPSTGEVGPDPTYGLRYASAVLDRLDLGDRWAYYHTPTSRWHGPAAHHIVDVCAGADVVINLAGIHPLRPWLAETPVRIYLDCDPVFTQLRHLKDARWRTLADAHNAFATFGENLPAGRSTVPDDSRPWYATRQPIDLDHWQATPGAPDAPFTTVMQWDSYKDEEWSGVRYGMKSAAFGPYLDLPSRSAATLQLAVGRMFEPRSLLTDRGWELLDPEEVTTDPWCYQRFIARSAGELSVAKHGYVISRSGWFSERSACYLASGRPVIVQDTGFSEVLPTGEGLLAFDDPDGALAALDDVQRRYRHHCRAARQVAEDYFDAHQVLTRLLSRAGAG